VIFGNILHDWDNNTKLMLLQKASEAIKEDGFVIIYEHFLDEDRTKLNPLLMSLHM
jgi:hypothetical protein